MLVWPPTADQPLTELNERKFAHSERFVLPRITAPPARSLAATVESRGAGAPFESERSGGGLHAIAGVDVALEKHRNAVQRAEHPARAAQRIRMARHRERVGVQLHHRIDAGTVLVEREDAPDVHARERFGGEAPRGHRGLQLRDGEILVAAPHGGRRLCVSSEGQEE